MAINAADSLESYVSRALDAVPIAPIVTPDFTGHADAVNVFRSESID
jgi:hypothetical protein